jgi:predicted nucleotidyltransferase
MRKLEYYEMKKLGILAVYLFGSAVEGITTVRSDIDIGIVFESPKNLKDTRSLYNTLYSKISKVFKPTFQRKLDIVFLQNASVTLQYNAITSGRLIYEKDPVKRANYEEKVVNQYMDFKPILEYFDKVASQRYAA